MKKISIIPTFEEVKEYSDSLPTPTPLEERFKKEFPEEISFGKRATQEILEFISAELSALKERMVAGVEGKKKSGIHDFEIGCNTCKWCNSERKGVYRSRRDIVMDEKSGGSSGTITEIQWDITGQYCEKNASSMYNTALSDTIQAIKELPL